MTHIPQTADIPLALLIAILAISGGAVLLIVGKSAKSNSLIVP